MIGIITLFYNNYNIGGLLQAYALQHVLTDLNIESEQICVWHYIKPELSFKDKIISKLLRMKNSPIKEIKRTIENKDIARRIKIINTELNRREEKMRKFMMQIPHSKEIYTYNNIEECLKYYDGFIVGSDQVWNDDYINKDNMKINMLSFVSDNHFKMSYSASIGKNDMFKEWFIQDLDELKRFNGVSVRELTAKQVIFKYIGLDTEITLDPTLLLNAQDWDKLINNHQGTDGTKYIFTYFLGKDKNNREFVTKLSEKMSLKIINFAHAINYYRDEDKNFGNESIIEYSPEDFIYYISHSSLVVTDSFHASVFSLIYHIPFYTLTRDSDNGIKSMNSRVRDLLETYNLSDRLLDSKMWNELTNPLEIDFTLFDQCIEKQRFNSKQYIITTYNNYLSKHKK